MQLHYLGTAAAEGFPGLFCDCDTCRRARAEGGRSLRTRSQALIDGRLLIDLPADTYWHITQNGLSLAGIRHCLITHAHSDHFYPTELECRCTWAAPAAEGTLTFHAGPAAAEQARQAALLTGAANDDRVAVDVLFPYTPVKIDRYTVTPLPANHDPLSTPYIYLIADGEKTLLYAHDTGLLSEETLQRLPQLTAHIDFVSLDCTGMLQHGWTDGHLTLDTCVTFMERLRRTGTADGSTQICLNPFSPNGGATHSEFVPIAAREGFAVSYDGMTVTF